MVPPGGIIILCKLKKSLLAWQQLLADGHNNIHFKLQQEFLEDFFEKTLDILFIPR